MIILKNAHLSVEIDEAHGAEIRGVFTPDGRNALAWYDWSSPTPVGRTNTHHIPSRDTGGNATLAAPKVYTGTKVKGIATMHKSNAVPVFSDEEAVEISRMRRG